MSEGEDAVQETWLHYEASTTQPTSTKAFLSAVVTRISIDVLRSARVRREEYVGQWLPEPPLTDPYEDPERSAELADSLSMAALLLLERLSPLERAVVVLREVPSKPARSEPAWSRCSFRGIALTASSRPTGAGPRHTSTTMYLAEYRCGPESGRSPSGGQSAALRDDLVSGRWAERNRELVTLDAAELGLRLFVA